MYRQAGGMFLTEQRGLFAVVEAISNPSMSRTTQSRRTLDRIGRPSSATNRLLSELCRIEAVHDSLPSPSFAGPKVPRLSRAIFHLHDNHQSMKLTMLPMWIFA
jgi:hypothetical protein